MSLPSQAYSQQNQQQSIQAIESTVLNAQAVNDVRFQFLHVRTTLTGASSAPEVDVIGAFTGGGTFPKNYTDDNKSEFQDNVTWLRGSHTIKVGRRKAIARRISPLWDSGPRSFCSPPAIRLRT